MFSRKKLLLFSRQKKGGNEVHRRHNRSFYRASIITAIAALFSCMQSYSRTLRANIDEVVQVERFVQVNSADNVIDTKLSTHDEAERRRNKETASENNINDVQVTQFTVKKEQQYDVLSQVPPGIAKQLELNMTEAGVDISDPHLYDSIDLKGDSSTATVMGFATGYRLEVYEQFVGSLRKSGYKGNIILGVAPDVTQEVLDYFKYRKVTPKIMKWVNCTYRDDQRGGQIFRETTCAHPYADIKVRWSRFPLARDWLEDCEICTGPILIMDVRDSLFQLDPFGPGSPIIRGLQVFQEHPTQTTQHWLTSGPFRGCKKTGMTKTMLCSGSTIGTRKAMLKYLEVMYAEMKQWIGNPNCRFNFNGDDQSIHNWLFYTGQLPFAHSIPNRKGIVNTVGVEGARILRAHREYLMATYNYSYGFAMGQPYPGAKGSRWIGVEYNLTNDQGQFTEADGSVSRVIHQFDRLGRPFTDRWLVHQDFINDPMPNKLYL